MALTITLTNKNSLTITNTDKFEGYTWNDANFTWEQATDSEWATPDLVLQKPAKNSLTITNTAKN